MSATLLPGFSEAISFICQKRPLTRRSPRFSGNSWKLFRGPNYVIDVAARGIKLKYFEKENLQKPLER